MEKRVNGARNGEGEKVMQMEDDGPALNDKRKFVANFKHEASRALHHEDPSLSKLTASEERNKRREEKRRRKEERRLRKEARSAAAAAG